MLFNKNREIRGVEMNLQVELIEKESVQYFKVVGELDAFTAPILKERFVSIQNTPGLQAEVDLSEVEYIDSTGLGVFVGFYKAIKENGGYVKITGVNVRLERLFRITGLDKIIDVEGKEEESRDATI